MENTNETENLEENICFKIYNTTVLNETTLNK